MYKPVKSQHLQYNVIDCEQKHGFVFSFEGVTFIVLASISIVGMSLAVLGLDSRLAVRLVSMCGRLGRKLK